MSGGYFEYNQYRISNIADSIERAILDNETDEYPYSPEVIEKFREAVPILRRAFIYAQRIDWLLSCDDGPESFLERLADELVVLDENP